MPSSLAGRVALVTGGSRNIGRAVSLRLAAEGATVALSFRGDDRAAAATIARMTELGATAVAYQASLEEPWTPAALAEKVALEVGPIDVLVHAAAIRPRQPLGTVSPAEFDAVMAVNARAGFLLAQAVAPAMVERGFGRIVFFGGLSAYVGQAGRAAVMASKLAVVGVARALAFELAGVGVTVNTVVPGRIATQRGDEAQYGPAHDPDELAARIPVGRLGMPEEVAELCAYLASPAAGYITGQELFVTGGAYPLTRDGVG